MEQIKLNETLPNQSISFDIDEGYIDLDLRTTETGLYCNIALNGEQIFYGRRCCNKSPLFLSPNVIKGNLYFKDLYGNNDPNYEEFNSRYILIYDKNYTIL